MLIICIFWVKKQSGQDERLNFIICAGGVAKKKKKIKIYFYDVGTHVVLTFQIRV